MPRIRYIAREFASSSLDLIEQADFICREYAAQDLVLTLRQVYYQFVSRDWLPNTPQSYKRLGSILNDARLAGLLDWSYMEDRTRNLTTQPHWDSPADIIRAAANSFRLDKWADQPWYVEVWIEKDALSGVIDPVCKRLDIPYFSCRGYTSQSEMWTAAMRVVDRIAVKRQRVMILHLGDHDPSGIDMTRDIEDRLDLFITRHLARNMYAWCEDDWGPVEDPPLQINRLALNMDQVRQYNPPPNPAKLSDSRSLPYVEQYGRSSWELDALEPRVMGQLIEDAVSEIRDEAAWADAVQQEQEDRARLDSLAEDWE